LIHRAATWSKVALPRTLEPDAGPFLRRSSAVGETLLKLPLLLFLSRRNLVELHQPEESNAEPDGDGVPLDPAVEAMW
jgi:hypothetical protein